MSSINLYSQNDTKIINRAGILKTTLRLYGDQDPSNYVQGKIIEENQKKT